MLHVYTGTGKGKTTAAMGLAARAAGHGLRVFVVCFLKEGVEGGEREALGKAGHVVFECFGRTGHVNPKHPDLEDVASARRALARAAEVMASKEWDVVIMDEVNVAYQFGLIELGELLKVVEARPPEVELVCTGRGAPIELMGIADYVTRMDSLKHPFDRGVEGRRGIEE
jgi:cob(I)alamin adenosyltransferase